MAHGLSQLSRGLLGGLLALGACGRGGAPPYWGVDHGADELVGLDDELFVVERVPVSEPLRLVSSCEALWVLAASAMPGRERLLRFEARSDGGLAQTGEGSVASVAAMCSGRRGAVLVLEHPSAGESCLWRIEPDFRRTLLASVPSAQALAAQSGAYLVGCASGELVLFREDGALTSVGQVEVGVQALSPGPRPGEWWVLGGGEDGRAEDARLALVDRHLVRRWGVRTGLATRVFAPVAGEERAWLAQGGRVRGFGPGGALELDFELGLGSFEARGADRAGLLLGSPGALIRLVPGAGVAHIDCTQGGFRDLVSVACVKQIPPEGP